MTADTQPAVGLGAATGGKGGAIQLALKTAHRAIQITAVKGKGDIGHTGVQWLAENTRLRRIIDRRDGDGCSAVSAPVTVTVAVA